MPAPIHAEIKVEKNPWEKIGLFLTYSVGFFAHLFNPKTRDKIISWAANTYVKTCIKKVAIKKVAIKSNGGDK